MREFGLCLLGRAVVDATFSEMMMPYAHASTITLAAQAAEIIIKAKVAEISPLLVFSKLPPFPQEDRDLMLGDLFESGRSHMYEELPSLLWAVTGKRIPNLPEYKAFGKLRNKIMHFAVPEGELADHTLSFAMTVVEPMVRDFWQISAISYAGEYDPEISYGYLEERITAIGLPIDEYLRSVLTPPSI